MVKLLLFLYPRYMVLPKFANIPVTQAKARLAAGVLTATYAKRKAPVVTIADRPIIQRRPKKVFTGKAAERGTHQNSLYS